MGEGVDFATAVETVDDRVVVRVTGELDMATVSSFEASLSSIEPDRHVVIDLSDCTFLDSSGIGAITRGVARAPRLSIVATEPSIIRVLEITALDTMVTVHASLDAVR